MNQKLGAGHASAMLRSGFDEFGQVLVAFPNSSIQPGRDPGLFGSATQLEVNADRGNSPSYDQYLESKAPVRQTAAPEQQAGRER